MKFKPVFTLFLALLITFSVNGQESLMSPNLENGLYRSFEDLKSGKIENQIPYREGVHSSKEAVTRYSLMHEGRFKPIKGIYCYVNDNHIYLNARNYGRKGYYIRSRFIGRYAFFEDRLGKEKFSTTRGAPGVVPPTGAAVTSKIWGIILDMETGKVVRSSRWRMKKLLAPYPKLWKAYKESDKSSEEVGDLIKKLNELLN